MITSSLLLTRLVSSATCFLSLFFYSDTPTTEIYTLSLHDALPICEHHQHVRARGLEAAPHFRGGAEGEPLVRLGDRKSTRLNSSHTVISYAVFCLKKKKREARPQFRKAWTSPSGGCGVVFGGTVVG